MATTTEGLTCPEGGEKHPSWARYCHQHEAYLRDQPEPSEAEQELEAAVKEEDVRQGVKDFLATVGFFVADLEQGHRPHVCPHCGGGIAGGSRVTEGLPDLFFAGHGYAAFAELKSPNGRIRPEQVRFRQVVEDEGGLPVHLWRSSSDAADWYDGWRSGEVRP